MFCSEDFFLQTRRSELELTFLLCSPQAWIEASTKGAVLLFTASEIENATSGLGLNPAVSGLLGGMGGGIAQAYVTMGELDRSFPVLDASRLQFERAVGFSCSSWTSAVNAYCLSAFDDCQDSAPA